MGGNQAVVSSAVVQRYARTAVCEICVENVVALRYACTAGEKVNVKSASDLVCAHLGGIMRI